nr:heme anaerobic degradation radical SAM methyltransferase ChuW/HutW [uncultured Desulfuromonas sp.]
MEPQKKTPSAERRFLNTMQGRPGSVGHGFTPPMISDDPLAKAFSRKYAIHPGMMEGSACSGSAEEQLRQEIRSSALNTPAMAYLHIPFCRAHCLFCGFYRESSQPQLMARYARSLGEEIRQAASMLRSAGQRLSAVYFGGGTPTDLSATDLAFLLQQVTGLLPLAKDCEITVEGRLFGFDDDKVMASLDNGANRFSFGVQSFDTHIRRRLGRKQSREELIQRLNRIVALGNPFHAAVVIDLIYGLPGQNATQWLADLDDALDHTAIHGLDLYQINLIPHTPLSAQKEQLPPMADLEQQSRLFSFGRRRMTAAGHQRLSIAHWGRDPRERNRYNLWNKAGVNCLPFGCGAGGRWGRTRFFQSGDLEDYFQRIEQGQKPVVSATLMPQGNTVTALAIAQLEQRHLRISELEKAADRPLAAQLRPMLDQWQQAGLFTLTSTEGGELTEAGEFWAVNLQQLISMRLKEILCDA